MRNILSFLFFLTSTISFAGNIVLHHKTIIDIDGKNKEWSSPLPNYDKNTGINYSVANDVNNLYFILRITDVSTIKQITQNGLEIWINKYGKKKKITGVTFPLPMKTMEVQKRDRPAEQQGESPEMRPKMGQEMNPGIKPEMNRKGPLPNKELMLTGFLINNGIQPVLGCRVRAAAAIDDSGCLIYELAVPFNTFYKEKLDQEDSATKFYIGFIIKNADSSSDEEIPSGRMMGGPGGGGGMMGGPGGGGGMMDGGGPGGMGPMGRPENMEGLTQSSTNIEKKYWFKIIPSLQ